MKIVIAPDSFKESLTAYEAALAFENGFKKVFPNAEYRKVPMADGGEGTVQSLVDSTNGEIINVNVVGPLGEEVTAFYGLLGDGKTAVIEMAAASGLHLVPKEKRDPLKTTTYGTGELILEAVNNGATHIILGLGGSATNDGGAGMAQALGVGLLDENDQPIGFGGGPLENLHRIELTNYDARLHNIKIDVACDVSNPLVGPEGASHIYGPQKGATPEMVQLLDQNLAHYANIIERGLERSVRDQAGAGAAGGIGAGLLAFLPSELKPGIDIVLETTRLEDAVKDADLVITGEGKIDHQTIYGKTPIGVAKIAQKYNVPVICMAGSVAPGGEVVYDHGISALFSIIPGIVTLDEAFANASENVMKLAENIARVFKIQGKI